MMSLWFGWFFPTPSSHSSLTTWQQGSQTCGCSAANGLQSWAAAACSSDGATTPVRVLVFDLVLYSGQLLDDLLVALHEQQLPGAGRGLQVECEHHLPQERKECGLRQAHWGGECLQIWDLASHQTLALRHLLCGAGRTLDTQRVGQM